MHDAIMHNWDMPQRALDFATKAHDGQQRKYSGAPYIIHPVAVSKIVATVKHTPEMIAAAYLHDVVEDTDVTVDEIEREFGDTVANLVYWLTDISKPEDGNRSARKEIDAVHYSKGPADAQTIKIADLIDNSLDIYKNDPNFWKVYKKEKLRILDLLVDADPVLVERARIVIETAHD